MAMDVVDFKIKGSEMQFVEVELDPGEAGSMMFMDAVIGMDSVFGDGRAQQGAGCAVRGVSLGIHFQQKLSVGFFGGVLGGILAGDDD